MAALPGAKELALVDLRRVRGVSLDALLDEETQEWKRDLDWDYRPSADLVRRFVRMQALLGYALLDGSQPAGYCYYVCEESKGLIGDLYLRPGWRDATNAMRLLGAMLHSIAGMPFIRRVESQLMLLPDMDRGLMPLSQYLRVHRRNFMLLDLNRAAPLERLRPSECIAVENWSERRQESAGQLIVRAYRSHIDSEINDQYLSPGGARRFLSNIIQYPGCGSFFQPGSFIAISRETGQLVGISLASLVAFDVGHITQICVDPESRGHGLGTELLCHSLDALRRARCRRTSLTVTAANEKAVELYRRLGFRLHHQFDAYVWEKLR
jgi:ribosomal protein S18 acetylase RimI-like enzyme